MSDAGESSSRVAPDHDVVSHHSTVGHDAPASEHAGLAPDTPAAASAAAPVNSAATCTLSVRAPPSHISSQLLETKHSAVSPCDGPETADSQAAGDESAKSEAADPSAPDAALSTFRAATKEQELRNAMHFIDSLKAIGDLTRYKPMPVLDTIKRSGAASGMSPLRAMRMSSPGRAAEAAYEAAVQQQEAAAAARAHPLPEGAHPLRFQEEYLERERRELQASSRMRADELSAALVAARTSPLSLPAQVPHAAARTLQETIDLNAANAANAAAAAASAAAANLAAAAANHASQMVHDAGVHSMSPSPFVGGGLSPHMSPARFLNAAATPMLPSDQALLDALDLPARGLEEETDRVIANSTGLRNLLELSLGGRDAVRKSGSKSPKRGATDFQFVPHISASKEEVARVAVQSALRSLPAWAGPSMDTMRYDQLLQQAVLEGLCVKADEGMWEPDKKLAKSFKKSVEGVIREAFERTAAKLEEEETAARAAVEESLGYEYEVLEKRRVIEEGLAWDAVLRSAIAQRRATPVAAAPAPAATPQTRLQSPQRMHADPTRCLFTTPPPAVSTGAIIDPTDMTHWLISKGWTPADAAAFAMDAASELDHKFCAEAGAVAAAASHPYADRASPRKATTGEVTENADAAANVQLAGWARVEEVLPDGTSIFNWKRE